MIFVGFWINSTLKQVVKYGISRTMLVKTSKYILQSYLISKFEKLNVCVKHPIDPKTKKKSY